MTREGEIREHCDELVDRQPILLLGIEHRRHQWRHARRVLAVLVNDRTEVLAERTYRNRPRLKIVGTTTNAHGKRRAPMRVIRCVQKKLVPGNLVIADLIEYIGELPRVERGRDAGVFEVDDLPGTATAIFSLCIDVARWYSRGEGVRPRASGRSTASWR